MPRPSRPWFRFYTEAFSDRKLLRLTPSQRWVWVSVLGAARESVEPGLLLVAHGVPMTHAELARYADVDVRAVKPALAIMVSLGMVEVTEQGIRVLNFHSRQFESDNVTARTQAHRERSKEQDGNVPKNVRRNAPETETETETEKEVPRKRGSRLPKGWMPDPEVKAAMMAENPGVDFARAHAKFADYWNDIPGAKGVKLDWNGTWRNWIRSEAERQPGGGKSAPSNPYALYENPK